MSQGKVLIIIDDPIPKRLETRSPALNEKIKQWYTIVKKTKMKKGE